MSTQPENGDIELTAKQFGILLNASGWFSGINGDKYLQNIIDAINSSIEYKIAAATSALTEKLKTMSVCELAGTLNNASLSEYMKHWEERAEKAEKSNTKKIWGKIHGNNMLKRAWLSGVGLADHEPWYTAEDGMNYSGYDVRFTPDNQLEADFEYERLKRVARNG